jgi:hypothetical protein
MAYTAQGPKYPPNIYATELGHQRQHSKLADESSGSRIAELGDGRRTEYGQSPASELRADDILLHMPFRQPMTPMEADSREVGDIPMSRQTYYQ